MDVSDQQELEERVGEIVLMDGLMEGFYLRFSLVSTLVCLIGSRLSSASLLGSNGRSGKGGLRSRRRI